MKWNTWGSAGAVLIAGLLLIVSVAACQSDGVNDTVKVIETGRTSDLEEEASPDSLRVTYWTPFSGGDGVFMSRIVQAFNNQHDDIQINQLNTRFNDYYTRLQTAIVAGNAPDMAIVHASRLPQFVNAGFLDPVGPATDLAQGEWSRYNRHVLDSVIYDGVSYGIPLDIHFLVMYYNKKMLDRAGVLNEEGKPVYSPSPEGFIEFLQTIKEHNSSHIAPLAQPDVRIDAYWMWWSFYNQMTDGGRFYDDNGEAALQSSAALKALDYVNRLYREEWIPPDIMDALRLFREGNAAVLITGVWAAGSLETEQGLDIGVVPMPTLYDQPAAWGDSHILVFPSRSGEPSRLRTASLQAAEWISAQGLMWAKAGHVPSMDSIVDSAVFREMKNRSEFAANVNTVRYWPRHPMQWPINDLMIAEFEKMLDGQQTPAETLQRAEQAVNGRMRQ